MKSNSDRSLPTTALRLLDGACDDDREGPPEMGASISLEQGSCDYRLKCKISFA